MHPATVYVVDDDPDVLRATERLLASAGWTAAAFQSPRAFLESCDDCKPGCLVLDLAMPELTGVELQKALAERGKLLPIVFLTGHGDIRTCAEAMKNGAVDFLTKPVDDADLLAAVARALRQVRHASAGARRTRPHGECPCSADRARAPGPDADRRRAAEQADRRRSRHGRRPSSSTAAT